MAIGIVTAIGSLLTLVIMVWRWVRRMRKYERELADEARKQLDKAHNGGDESDTLDAWDRINRADRV